MKKENLENLKKFLSPVMVRATQIIASRAKGSWIFDKSGKKYLDFTSGVGVVSTGHCHPQIVSAIKKQTKKMLHGMAGIVYNEPNLQLAEKLAEITPTGIDSFFFTQSGTEAVEGALKLVKYVSKKPGIIAFYGGFHGRTLGALSVTTSKKKFREGYEPLLPEVYFFPYPYCFRCPFGKRKYPECRENEEIGCAADLRKFFEKIKNKEVGGAIIEPILGEGGYTAAPQEFLKLLRKLCTENKIFLIFDEIQSGVGRTGKWWASQWSKVIPDVLVMAKGLASGMPLGAIGASKKLMSLWKPGAHGGTYSGNPVCCQSALTTIEIIEKEKLLTNAQKVGKLLFEKLLDFQKKFKFIGDVRGYGLMLGIEFVNFQNLTAGEIVKKVKELSLQKNLILISCGPDDSVIRLIPPLNVKVTEAKIALRILEEVFRKII